MSRRKTKLKAKIEADWLADQIEAVSTMMWAVAERMECHAGCSVEMNKHAREMAGAATIARGWAKAIRDALAAWNGSLENAEAHGRAVARTVQPLVGSLDGDK